MPMAPGSDQATISRNIDELTHHGSRPRSHAQIVAIALSNADKHPGHAFGGGIGSPHKVDILPQPKIAAFHPPKIITPSQGTPFWTRSAAHEMDQPVKTKFAKGGGIGHMADGGYSSADDPWFERSEARAIVDQPMHSGLIPGAGAGRTDRLPLAVGSNSHIVPADAVSGAGQGNTANGVAAWQAAIHGGPYGVPLPKEVHGHGPPSPPHVSTAQLGFAAGGEHHEKTPILAAPGEMVIAVLSSALLVASVARK